MMINRPPRHAFDCAEYDLWRNYVQKTTNPKNPAYRYWGTIKLCDEWRTPLGFINGIRQHGYEKGKRMLLIDWTKNIEPNNIKFVNLKDARRERNLKPVCEGREVNVREVAQQLGLHVSSVYRRLKTFPYWKLVTAPPRSKHLYKYKKVQRPHPLAEGHVLVDIVKEEKTKPRRNFSFEFI